jgi:hypothetical protein
MNSRDRGLLWVVIVLLAMGIAGCDNGGIGSGLPASGARWGSGAAGPDVLVGGGPVYR